MTIELFVVSLGRLVFLALLLGSGYLWVCLALRFAAGEPLLPSRFRSETASVPIFVFAVAAMYLAMGLSQFFVADRVIPTQAEDIIKLLKGSIVEGVIVSLFLGITLLSLTRRRTELYRLGFRFDHLSRQFADAGLGFVAALLPVFSVIYLTARFRSLETTHPFLQLLNEQGIGSEFLAVVLAAVVIAPLKEELIFRVILQSSLVRWCGVKAGIVITAVLFAAVHGFPDALGLLPLALILGYVYHRRRSFISVVLLHALFNAFNIGLLVLQQTAKSVSSTTDVIP